MVLMIVWRHGATCSVVVRAARPGAAAGVQGTQRGCVLAPFPTAGQLIRAEAQLRDALEQAHTANRLSRMADAALWQVLAAVPRATGTSAL